MSTRQDLEMRNYMRFAARFSPSIIGSGLSSATGASTQTSAAQNSDSELTYSILMLMN
jgi:hypothetical protein